MRRIISLIVALAIALSVALIGSVSASAESNLAASDECIKILKGFEGFSSKPYYDYGQYTIGYGTKCPADKLDYYRTHGITEAEAEELLRKHIAGYNNEVNGFADTYGLTMTQNQFDALILFSFNCGSGWIYSTNQNFHQTMAKGSAATPAEVLYWFTTWSSAGGSTLPGLVRRRMSEANMYLNGIYSTSIPDNYSYVTYDAGGGEVPSRVHAYDSLTATTPIIPTYEGHTFMGWHTSKTGGYLVNSLTESLDGMKLYARWDNAGTTEGEFGDNIQDITPVEITVTGSGVNLRKGPGTNYATVGRANRGDKLTITQIGEGSGLKWGNFGTGWICLDYTNYDEVSVAPPVDPTPSDPTEPSEPQPSEPQPSEPQPTEPQPTEPQPTEPQPSEPTPPAQSVTGKVKANGGLNIRSGPSTGHSVVGHLSNGAAVTILEQQNAGSMIWGKIDKGWISMNYVVLDTADEPTDPDPGDQTGAVTGYIKVSGGLNIRSGPGTTYSIVGSYSNGDKVTITQQQTVGSVTWGKTALGWISMNYFTTTAPGEGTEPWPGVVSGTVKVSDVLRIRSGPGTSYAVAGYYYNGDKVAVTQQKTVGSITWGKTEKGWISMQYVVVGSTDNDDDGDTTEPTEPAVETRTVTADCLNVRSGAGTGYSVVGYLYTGARVQILEKVTVDGVQWGKIANGWICLTYTA